MIVPGVARVGALGPSGLDGPGTWLLTHPPRVEQEAQGRLARGPAEPRAAGLPEHDEAVVERAAPEPVTLPEGAHAVAAQQRPQAGVGGRCAPQVDGFGGGFEDRGVAQVARPEREVRLLGVEEVGLVPPAGSGHAARIDQQQGTLRPVDDVAGPVARSGGHQLPERSDPAGGAGTDEGVGRLTQDGGFPPEGVEQVTAFVAQHGDRDAGTGLPQGGEQGSAAPGGEPDVRVEHEDRGVVARVGGDAGVDPRRVAPVEG